MLYIPKTSHHLINDEYWSNLSHLIDDGFLLVVHASHTMP